MGDAPPDSPAAPSAPPAAGSDADAAAAPAPAAQPIPLVAAIAPPPDPIPEGVAAVLRATRDPIIGTTVLGYEVKQKIGQGGMGIVYEAEQAMIGKRVALKVLRPEMANKPDQVEALVAEARAVNRVGHRGIIDVFAFGVLPDGRQCIAMELLVGESLQDRLTRNRKENRPMLVGEVLMILEEVLSALAAAHGAGVIHRDLKPSNIFLVKQSDGSRYTKLLDFGIAKLDAGAAAPSSNLSLIMGTPLYMAPEQATRGKVTPALDLYAVGVIAFELLTNRVPFDGKDLFEILHHHAETPPPRPSEVLMSIPDEVDDIVLSLLQKNAEDRPQDANKVRLVVKRARKLLVHSTAHPELQLTRDKATGKLVLEDRSGGPASGPLLLPGSKKASISSPRSRAVGPAPAPKPPPAAKKIVDDGERTLPPDPPSRLGKPDDATFVPGRVSAADLAELRREARAARPPDVVADEAALAPGGGWKPWALVAVGFVVGLGALGWTVRARLRPSGPSIVEITEQGPDLGALDKRLAALDQRLTEALAAGKKVGPIAERVKALRKELGTRDAKAVDAELSELEGGIGY